MLFQKKNVASVLKVFTKAIADLEEVIQQSDATAVREEEKIVLAKEAAKAANAEAKLARSVADNLQKLLSL